MGAALRACSADIQESDSVSAMMTMITFASVCDKYKKANVEYWRCGVDDISGRL